MKRLAIKRVVMSILVLVLAVSGGYAGTRFLLPFIFGGPENPEPEEFHNRLNFLLLGHDAREGEDVARADSILFVSADPETQRLSIMSIPRDTRVNIPDHGWDKINATTVYGGPELTREVVSELLGLPIDYYVMTNIEGFKAIINTLGGVTINVEKRMKYRDPRDTPPLVIDLQPGEQRLDGEQAVGYVRYRSDGSDIDRTQRQQKFLSAVVDEMMKTKNIIKLPTLVSKISRSIDSNLDSREMIRWAGFAWNLDRMEVVTATLPGIFLNSEGLSYWFVDPDRAREVAIQLMDGKEIGDPVEEQTVQSVAYQSAKPAPEPTPEPTPEPAPEPPPVETGPEADPSITPGAPQSSTPQTSPNGQNGGEPAESPAVDPDESRLDDQTTGKKSDDQASEDEPDDQETVKVPDYRWAIPPPPPSGSPG